ncbi:MAG: hypothetical protein OEU26_35340 [Candidatus Tectomicrobia bacterium]|nr:hypothetical protein [Candidatus Tectomicrobia bacterium]
MHPSPKTQMDRIRHYQVALVEKAAMPQGAEGEDWYRYVLESGYAAITGWRRGSLKEITQHAIRCTEELNARSTDGFSRWAHGRKT